jgi:hypothetical protein
MLIAGAEGTSIVDINTRKPALFVSYHRFLEPEGGGVQMCSREYVASLKAAEFDLDFLPYEFPSDLRARVRRKICPEIWHTLEPSELYQKIEHAIQNKGAEFLFFGHTMFAGLSRKLKQALPNVQQVLLSHGAEGFDFCLEQQIRRRTNSENRPRASAERMIGESLLHQMDQRRWIDAVLTLSAFEVEIEKWLGAPKALWLPRMIVEPQLDTNPVDQRVGCVSTLDHPPNHQGLVELLEVLSTSASPTFRFRLVGAPQKIGIALMKRFSFVEYLGALSNSQLRSEAATWCCFVHPIFVYAKGCSTKLAIGVGWQLPIATTVYGARGYVWDSKRLPLAEDAKSLAEFVMQRCRKDVFDGYRMESRSIAALAPSLTQIGRQLREFLWLNSPSN